MYIVRPSRISSLKTQKMVIVDHSSAFELLLGTRHSSSVASLASFVVIIVSFIGRRRGSASLVVQIHIQKLNFVHVGSNLNGCGLLLQNFCQTGNLFVVLNKMSFG